MSGKNKITVLISFFCVLITSYTVFTALSVNIEYFDSYSYIVSALKLISNSGDGIANIHYAFDKPPGIPLIYSLSQLFYEPGNPEMALLAAKIILITCTFVLFFFLYYKKSIPHPYYLLAIFILLFERIFVRYSGFVMSEIPSTLLVYLTFYTFTKYTGNVSFYAKFKLCVVSAILLCCRYNLILFYVPIALADIFSNKTGKFKKFTLFWLIPSNIFLFLAIQYLVLNLARTGNSDLLSLKMFFTHDLPEILKLQLRIGTDTGNQNFSDPPYEYLFSLHKVFGSPLIILLLLGIFHCWDKKVKGFILHISWILTMLTVHSLFIKIREVRYLFPILPSMVFFQVYGFRHIFDAIQIKWKDKRKKVILAVSLVLIVAIAPSLSGVGSEIQKFNSPIYKKNTLKKLSEQLISLAGKSKKIYWMNKFYPVFPKDPIFHQNDEYYYIHSLSSNSLAYFIGKTVHLIPNYIDPYNVLKFKKLLIQNIFEDAVLIMSVPINVNSKSTLTLRKPFPPLSVYDVSRKSVILHGLALEVIHKLIGNSLDTGWSVFLSGKAVKKNDIKSKKLSKYSGKTLELVKYKIYNFHFDSQ